MYYLAADVIGSNEADAVAMVLSEMGEPAQAGGAITLDLDAWNRIWSAVQAKIAEWAVGGVTFTADPTKTARALTARGYLLAPGVPPGAPTASGNEAWYLKLAQALGVAVGEVVGMQQRAGAPGDTVAGQWAKDHGVSIYRDPVTGEIRFALPRQEERSTAQILWDSVKTSLPVLLIGGAVLYAVARARR